MLSTDSLKRSFAPPKTCLLPEAAPTPLPSSSDTASTGPLKLQTLSLLAVPIAAAALRVPGSTLPGHLEAAAAETYSRVAHRLSSAQHAKIVLMAPDYAAEAKPYLAGETLLHTAMTLLDGVEVGLEELKSLARPTRWERAQRVLFCQRRRQDEAWNFWVGEVESHIGAVRQLTLEGRGHRMHHISIADLRESLADRASTIEFHMVSDPLLVGLWNPALTLQGVADTLRKTEKVRAYLSRTASSLGLRPI